MIKDIEAIKAYIRKLDWKKVSTLLDTQTDANEEFLELLTLVLHTDTIVRRRPGDDGKKRDRFLELLGNHYVEHGISHATKEVADMRDELIKIDRGYEEIYSEASKLESAKHSPTQRVSGVFVAAGAALKNIIADLERQVKKNKGRLETSRNIQSIEKHMYDPSSNLHGLTAAAGDIIMLEAYKGGWFDSEDRVVIPALPEVEQAVVESVVYNIHNANTWRTWKGIDERVRFLQADLNFLDADLESWREQIKKDGGPQIEDKCKAAFEFKPNHRTEMFDVLANERFDVIQEQNFRELAYMTNAAEKVNSSSGAIEMPPKSYVSVDEINANTMFKFFTKMDSGKVHSQGLSIAEIIRGYATLKNFIEKHQDKNSEWTPCVSQRVLQEELVRCGLPTAKASAFIDRVTFCRSSRDLYDHPLIKCQDENFYVFGPSLLLCDIVKITISSLANEGTSFDDKGELFEESTKKSLQRHGFEPRNLKVRRGANKEEFDYDVAFVWDDHVFFLECKNRGLPMGNPIATYRFMNELESHIKQVERLKRGLHDHPDILEKDFPEAVGKKPVFCLLNAMPFACGEIEGIYAVDDSIFFRFFASSTFGVTAVPIDRKRPSKRTPLRRIWKSAEPTVEEFIEYLAKPPQLDLAAQNYELAPRIEYLSNNVCGKIIDFKRKDLNSDQITKLLKGDKSSSPGYRSNHLSIAKNHAAREKKSKIKAKKKIQGKKSF
ncbi:TPA: hypothetical protein P9G65_004919 [Pseudomonas aeruginosa]|nr:hypothetical protein [Pseudomonas aeruginosa]HDQ4722652.1 hypothetical protein [Pseudomonas aeruginosa]